MNSVACRVRGGTLEAQEAGASSAGNYHHHLSSLNPIAACLVTSYPLGLLFGTHGMLPFPGFTQATRLEAVLHTFRPASVSEPWALDDLSN